METTEEPVFALPSEINDMDYEELIQWFKQFLNISNYEFYTAEDLAVSVSVSIYTLTVIAIDRYYAVLYPMKLRMTNHRARYIIVVIWLLAVSMSAVQLVTARASPYELNDGDVEGDTVYFCYERMNPDVAKAYEMFILTITYVMPLVIQCFAYYNVGKRLWGRQLPGNADESRDIAHNKSKKKMIKMLVTVVTLFALCWLPLQVFNAVHIFLPYLYRDVDSQNIMRICNSCFLLLACANSFMNPFVYGLVNDTFRADLKRLILCRSRNRNTFRNSGVSQFTRTTRNTSWKRSSNTEQSTH
uniref:Tachykinin-like peptides receptor 86C-like n=1 Tax=Saccoglossus kowalevskii TaxID=10224 RepID=A0ABM0MDL8_SACKO|nr:PREDICTED: tachykinin-like peptides receptor 86C-like [Saccoglossus kowalevskii]